MIQATFNAVADNYGTWHNLRREALGVSDDQLEVFKSYVLTEKISIRALGAGKIRVQI